MWLRDTFHSFLFFFSHRESQLWKWFFGTQLTRSHTFLWGCDTETAVKNIIAIVVAKKTKDRTRKLELSNKTFRHKKTMPFCFICLWSIAWSTTDVCQLGNKWQMSNVKQLQCELLPLSLLVFLFSCWCFFSLHSFCKTCFDLPSSTNVSNKCESHASQEKPRNCSSLKRKESSSILSEENGALMESWNPKKKWVNSCDRQRFTDPTPIDCHGEDHWSHSTSNLNDGDLLIAS